MGIHKNVFALVELISSGHQGMLSLAGENRELKESGWGGQTSVLKENRESSLRGGGGGETQGMFRRKGPWG